MTEETKRQFQMFVPEDDGSAMDWLETIIDNAIQEERNRLVEEIEKMKSDTRQDTGSFKYDYYYDEVINLIKPSN